MVADHAHFVIIMTQWGIIEAHVIIKLHGYPSKKANAVSADSTHHKVVPPMFSTAQYNKILSMIDSDSPTPHANLTGISLSCSFNSIWIVDSGATNHVSSSLHLFSSYTACSKHSTLKLPDGTYHLLLTSGVLYSHHCCVLIIFFLFRPFNLI